MKRKKAARRTVLRPVREPAAYARVRQICMTYPEATEKSSWGHPNFRAGKKTFVALEAWQGRPSIAFRLEPEQVRELVRDPHFFVTPYGRGQWVSRYADGRPSWRMIRALIEQSYRLVATPRMCKALDEPLREPGAAE